MQGHRQDGYLLSDKERRMIFVELLINGERRIGRLIDEGRETYYVMLNGRILPIRKDDNRIVRITI